MKNQDPNERICRCCSAGPGYSGLPFTIAMLDRQAEREKESALKRLERLVEKCERDAKKEDNRK